MLSLDTEDTGVDLHHGARPFFVTTCDEEGNQQWWEWAVDPLTREPKIPQGDVEEIQSIIHLESGKELILQNPKYDATALEKIGIAHWPWSITRCTLMAGHLLDSGARHDLTTMVLEWVGHDLERFEKALERACNDARRLARKKFPEWKLAKEGLAEMPSAKSGKKKKEQGLESESPWKFDSWLPRALWMRGEGEAYWETVLREYGNSDSVGTMALWKYQKAELIKRGLWEIYLQRMQVIPVIGSMECYGVTYSTIRRRKLQGIYTEQITCLGQELVDVAKDKGFELELPKGASPNGSLLDFIEAADGLNLIPLISPTAHSDFGRGGSAAVLGFDNRNETKEERKARFAERANTPGFGKNGRMTFDSATIEAMITTLEVTEPNSPRCLFLKKLLRKRKRDTSLSYLAAYERFGRQFKIGWARLHPHLNPTGSSTLRFSSSNPNEQNISKKEAACKACDGEGCGDCGNTGVDLYSIRYCFGPAPGREWWSFDARNIELRLPAYESKEKELIALFERPDDPPYYGSTHLLNFHTVYPAIWAKELVKVGLAKVGPHCKKLYASTNYQWCKNGGFAVQYGAVRKRGGTADKAFHVDGAHDLLADRFSRLEALNQYWINFADLHGYVETMPDRSVSKRGYPLMCTRSEWGRILPTVPLNYHIQGTAMWWMMQAMIRVHAFFEYLNNGGEFLGRVWQGGYFIVLQVHDELVVDAPAGKGDEPWEYNKPIMKHVQKLMEQGGEDIGVPTPTSCEYHKECWSQGIAV